MVCSLGGERRNKSFLSLLRGRLHPDASAEHLAPAQIKGRLGKAPDHFRIFLPRNHL